MSTAPFDAGTHAAQDAAALLRTTACVRERCGQLLARARRGESDWFTVDDSALGATAKAVADSTRKRYPKLHIPYHSRWRHFEAGGIDRAAALERRLGDADPRERARMQIDLALVSVLLDAGAGADWGYVEPGSGRRYTRSEGLGVASLHAFAAGLFSSDPRQPLQADADGLAGLDAARLAAAFQAGADNPLLGLDGRAALLRRLAAALRARPELFGADGRPGRLFDALAPAGTEAIDAHAILSLLLDALAPIWPAGNAIGGSPDPALALGDCWRHDAVRGPGLSDGWMPFHKLSQWLSYSLLEPFERAGVRVHRLEALTALPEYRNGGLLLDSGVLAVRDAAWLARRWQVGDEFVVEWRALTVALLDELAPRVADALGLRSDALPLARVLEGGSWAAGRALAQRLRAGAPPLAIDSDGTVF